MQTKSANRALDRDSRAQLPSRASAPVAQALRKVPSLENMKRRGAFPPSRNYLGSKQPFPHQLEEEF